MTETEIYDDFYELSPDNSVDIIKLYERNQILLNNKSEFKDEDEFNDYVLLLAKYAISLEKLGRYSKAVEYADKLLRIVDSKAEKFNIKKNDFTTYWSLLMTKGRSLYQMKDYKESISIFETLLEHDNENDNIRNWLEASKSRKRNSINKYFYISASILIITEIFIGNYFENPRVKLYMSGLGFILFMIALINEYFIDKILNFIKKGK